MLKLIYLILKIIIKDSTNYKVEKITNKGITSVILTTKSYIYEIGGKSFKQFMETDFFIESELDKYLTRTRG